MGGIHLTNDAKGKQYLVVKNDKDNEGIKPVTISKFMLINAKKDQKISELKEGSVIDLAILSGAPLNIQAEVCSPITGSVGFELRGVTSYHKVENVSPYALFGNAKNDFLGSTLPVGAYSLTAIPFSGKKGRGTKGIPHTIHFTVSYSAAVQGFTLVNADSNKDIMELKDGAVIDPAAFPGAKLNIRAHTTPNQVGSVSFHMQGPLQRRHAENLTPYALFADDTKGNYYGVTLPEGAYTLTAKSYSRTWGKGAGGVSQRIHFRVERSTDTGCDKPGFSPPATYFSGATGLSTIIAGDFNGDPYQDLAVTSIFSNLNDNNVGVLLSNSDGTFRNAVLYHSGGNSVSIAGGDFNEDGRMDLAVANAYDFGDGNLGLMLGNGDGTFAPPMISNIGGLPKIIHTTDINKDGKLDLITATTSQEILIMLGKGAGLFATPLPVISNPVIPVPLIIQDLNNDANLDLVTMVFDPDIFSSRICVMLGKGDGTFKDQQVYTGVYNILSYTSGDFNRDGKIDLVVTSNGSDPSHILLGDGAGGFANPLPQTEDFGAFSMTTGDFNGDGKIDLVGVPGNNQVPAISVNLGNGDGTFAPKVIFPSGNAFPNSLVAADFNQDKVPDLAVNNDDGTAGILMNLCTSSGATPVLARASKEKATPVMEQETATLKAAPNPFTSQTIISYSVENTGYVVLGVYNGNGVEVARLFQGQAEGRRTYQVRFNSSGLPGGVYVMQLTTAASSISSKVVLLR
ncbi:hypothetical protein BUE76_22120 [Cnuella takakiae]|nr:hypothetical protein BUE76_22120 [Cnuella takakiae]